MSTIDSGSNPTTPKVRTRVAGESFVWLTAMGLSVALLMVIGLLTIVVANGVSAFWPHPVERFTLHDGSIIFGEILERRTKPLAGKPCEELQLYTGNKDVYGNAFRFVNVTDIAQTTRPLEVMMIERSEYGNALGTPLRLEVSGESPLPASDSHFADRLDVLIHEVAERRVAITHVEKNLIGANSQRIDDLKLSIKSLESEKDKSPAIVQAQAEIAQLQSEYQILARRAADLRAEQRHNAVIIQLADGSEKRIPLGAVIDIVRPNQLSTIGRLGQALHHAWNFVSDVPREANTEGGIFPAIFGTFVMTLLMSLAVTPFGVVAAIYLREYAKQGPIVRGVRIAVNNLAGVPSIVFGVFGLGFFVYIVGGSIDSLFFANKLPTPTFGTGGILWSALTLALMTVPVVIVATEESIAAVPRGMKEGSLACGASKWQTIQRIVLPAAVPGILTGLILAMARGAGEVAPLMLVGVVKLAPTLPLNMDSPFIHLDQKFMHLGFHIYDLGFQSPDSDAAKPMVFATTLFLIGLVLVLNLGAIILRDRLRKRFATGAF